MHMIIYDKIKMRRSTMVGERLVWQQWLIWFTYSLLYLLTWEKGYFQYKIWQIQVSVRITFKIATDRFIVKVWTRDLSLKIDWHSTQLCLSQFCLMLMKCSIRQSKIQCCVCPMYTLPQASGWEMLRFVIGIIHPWPDDAYGLTNVLSL